MMKFNCNKNGSPISGHKFKLIKQIALNRINGEHLANLEIGRVDNHDWWIHILAERNINGCPCQFTKHFKRVCNCKKYLCKNK